MSNFHGKCVVNIVVGKGLQCFECKLDTDHICYQKGIQEGRKLNCSSNENACVKNVGGKDL